jgi:thiamine biosynthesis lipoprotein
MTCNRFTLFLAVILSLSLLLANGCGMKKEVLISGRTMGTFYHIKVISGYFEDLSDLREKIEARLEEINQSMSTYRPDSEISRFNKMPDTETMAVSADFLKVLKASKKIYELSDGAWDGTVKPLVNLWGFGSARPVRTAPDRAEIEKRLKTIGFDHIRVLDSGRIGKKIAGVTLDLASIAKGFGVDVIAEVVRQKGYRNFLVEIGGEVVASGVRKDGRPWVVGINRPTPEAAVNKVYRTVSLTNGAMATSGDYRNFFELEGVRYSHVIDPRTGYPVNSRVASVSIVAPDCTLADGLATALMVMGPEKGIPLVNRLENVECLIIVHAQNGQFSDYASNGFPK